MSAATDLLEARLLRELPRLGNDERRGLAQLLDVLVREFAPERIYVFGSHARGDSGADSDVDLLVLLPDLPAPAHELDRRARELAGPRSFALDLVFMARARFEERLPALASLPATVAREGKLVYDSGRAAA
jgi:predicted nucleotidyltransferase